MAFTLEFARACFFVGGECARARARGNGNADHTRDRERTKHRKGWRQIAHSLAKQWRRSPCAKCIRIYAFAARATNFHAKTQRQDALVFIILEELIFGAEFEIAESAD